METNMLYRKAKKQLIDWLTNSNDALLVDGARQIGKSYLIRETLKEQNVDFVEFNFIKQPKLKTIFDSAIAEDVDKFLLELRVAAKRILGKNSVVFFDEIQECKEVATAIKFLVEQGQFRYVLSGSLLGIELENIKSVPTGYLSIIDMYPMDLEEFFIANGLGEDVIEHLKDCFDKRVKVSDLVHDSLVEATYRYAIVGGMPEAVQKYVDTGDFNEVSKVHKKIYRLYKKDFTKYESDPKSKLKLVGTYELIPSELNSKNKRYTFTNLDKELHFDRYENSFIWLKKAGVALPTFNSTELAIPLEANKKSNLFKLFISDVGMLTTTYGNTTILKILNRDKDINCGSMFENLVAQELNSHGFDLFYYNNKKHGELDFIIEYKDKVTPIEVKSGKDYQNHSALTYFINSNTFSNAFVLSNYNVEVDDRITYLPIYMIMFIEKNEPFVIKKKLELGKIKL